MRSPLMRRKRFNVTVPYEHDDSKTKGLQVSTCADAPGGLFYLWEQRADHKSSLRLTHEQATSMLGGSEVDKCQA